MPLVLLAQVFGAAEWIGLIAVALPILAGLIHVVWKLSAMDSRLAHIEQWCRKHDEQDSDLSDRLGDHEVRIVRLESTNRRWLDMGS